MFEPVLKVSHAFRIHALRRYRHTGPMPSPVLRPPRYRGTHLSLSGAGSLRPDRDLLQLRTEMPGPELGGALKNIIALGAGISDGMGFGDNAKAALITRGIAEITRLGIALGAQPETFAGLAGVGDLIVTCTSMHSRNRRCGIMIGEGMSPKEAIEKVGMVVEGMFTAEAAYQLAQRVKVEMPITEQIYKAIQGEVDPRDAVNNLMTRERKHEQA